MAILKDILVSCARKHRDIYQECFDYIDSDRDGRVLGDEANEFFSMTGIENHQLKKDGRVERRVDGHNIVVQEDMPLNGLTSFGETFLSNFECSQMSNPILEHIMFGDTPGVLAGEKQLTNKSYDFTGVIKWFAEKCVIIILMFDPHSIDISDEFKGVITLSLRGQDHKIRVVLNKTDQLDNEQVQRSFHL